MRRRKLVREEVGYEGRAFNCFSVFSVQCDIVPVIEYNFGTGIGRYILTGRRVFSISLIDFPNQIPESRVGLMSV